MKPIQKILIVDDNIENQGVLTTKFRRQLGSNIDIRTARLIVEARLILETFQPDLAMCDFNLPDGKGPDLFPRLRDLESRPYICLMSGTDFNDRHGADIFVHKPELTILIDAILMVAPRRP